MKVHRGESDLRLILDVAELERRAKEEEQRWREYDLTEKEPDAEQGARDTEQP